MGQSLILKLTANRDEEFDTLRIWFYLLLTAAMTQFLSFWKSDFGYSDTL